MHSYRRPQLRPNRHWHLSAYLRTLQRIVAAVVLTFACFRASDGAIYTWYRVTGNYPYHQPTVDQTLNGVLPYRVIDPIYVQFGDYVVSVIQSPVAAVVVVTALMTLFVHVVLQYRRR